MATASPTSSNLGPNESELQQMKAQIRPMQPKDVADVVAVHCGSFPGFFLTFLGPRFLRLLYSEILRSPDHVAYVALDENGSVVGFVAGVTEQSGFFGRLARRRWVAFGWAAAGAAIRRPSIIPRLARALKRPRETQDSATSALLMSIAVNPQSAGHGVGASLVRRFLETMHERNIRAVSLTTDRDNNERTNRFYQHLNFRLVREFATPEGRWMNEYMADVTDAECGVSEVQQKVESSI